MRKIEQVLRNHFWNGKPVRISNSAVVIEGTDIKLLYHGNLIAIKPLFEHYIEFSLAGWNTLTTRSRLHNVVSIPIGQKKFVPVVYDFHGKAHPINSDAWYRLDNEERPIQVN